MEEQITLPKKLVPFFWYFVKPYKWLTLTFFISGLLWGIQISLSPYLLKIIIDTLATFEGEKFRKAYTNL